MGSPRNGVLECNSKNEMNALHLKIRDKTNKIVPIADSTEIITAATTIAIHQIRERLFREYVNDDFEFPISIIITHPQSQREERIELRTIRTRNL